MTCMVTSWKHMTPEVDPEEDSTKLLHSFSERLGYVTHYKFSLLFSL